MRGEPGSQFILAIVFGEYTPTPAVIGSTENREQRNRSNFVLLIPHLRKVDSL